MNITVSGIERTPITGTVGNLITRTISVNTVGTYLATTTPTGLSVELNLRHNSAESKNRLGVILRGLLSKMLCLAQRRIVR